jgi:hypothetical protein
MLPKLLTLIAAVALALTAVPAGAADAPEPNPVTINAAEEITAAALAQIKGQERQIHELRASNELQRQELAELKARKAAADATGVWLPVLMGLAVVMGAISLFLGWRLRRLMRRLAPSNAAGGATAGRQRAAAPAGGRPAGAVAARAASDGLLSGAAPLMISEPTVAGLAPMTAIPRPLSAARAEPAPPPPPAPPRPAPELGLATGVPPREVTVEEMMDLEQQVDFFVVLGQDEAAIDLLVSHIRATGGTSALPYLKLLEIYGQRGDEAGYERIQSRFNQRFNALAPPWGSDLNEGRLLEDYAEVVERLQVLWPFAQDTMAEIEALLRPSDERPLFELPAFRDLLTLLGVAGDLLSQTVSVAPALTTVDVLLPLGEGPRAHDATSPHAWRAPIGTETPMLMPRPGAALLADTDSWRGSLSSGGDVEGALDVDLDIATSPPAPREFTQPAGFSDVDLFRDSRRSDFAALGDPIDPVPSRRQP